MESITEESGNLFFSGKYGGIWCWDANHPTVWVQMQSWSWLLWDKEEGALKPPTKMFLGLNRPILMGKQITRGNRKQYFAKSLLKIQEALCLNLHFNSFFHGIQFIMLRMGLRGTCQHCPADQHFWNFVLIGNNFVICLLAKNRQTSSQSRRDLRASTCGFRATCH